MLIYTGPRPLSGKPDMATGFQAPRKCRPRTNGMFAHRSHRIYIWKHISAPLGDLIAYGCGGSIWVVFVGVGSAMPFGI